jgi:hypothetical protein
MNSLEELIETLAQSLGDQTARAVVSREAAALGYGPAITPAEALVLLGKLETLNGTAGLAARLIRVRFERTAGTVAAKSSTQSMPAVREPSSQRDTGPRETAATGVRTNLLIPMFEIEALFAKSLGDAAAKDVVHRAVIQLGVSPIINNATPCLRREDASRLLDLVEGSGGVAAAVASFAKARFLLRFR